MGGILSIVMAMAVTIEMVKLSLVAITSLKLSSASAAGPPLPHYTAGVARHT